ncbi:hypothetical protein JTE90_003918 [Oedothorax gibbosus]|uniref:Uncharacterized protein n=1 Tax=Oedothorax gibbosus TaxID=931172 RepID=A0AAV6TLH2_9ARAC|nr:hypothetical protein JTE90_003918 [Oedothorax gibbosus]
MASVDSRIFETGKLPAVDSIPFSVSMDITDCSCNYCFGVVGRSSPDKFESIHERHRFKFVKCPRCDVYLFLGSLT